ncbi:S66 peptidase family protein [Robertkochia flava]|uniref:S66 peptidase family protein n=1 Tax=Robertkochia flava TaxID=3447986 RepID=UPI001CCC9DD9|nr:LD-carboxypeptidase [Robertkochia marina]
MKRRNFIKKSITVPAVSLLPVGTLLAMEQTATEQPFMHATLAKRLEPGDTLGLIAPGYAVSPEKLEEAIGYVEELGFKVYHTDRITGNYGYLSNTDEERLADLHHMFENDDVDGILCVRGGYGCTRILPGINWELIRNHPKIFTGFSDVTALLNEMNRQTGLVCFHGPVGTTLDTDYNKEHFLRIINGDQSEIILSPYPYHEEEEEKPEEYQPYLLKPGKATGILAGGNLSLLAAMTGTPYEPDYTNKIVFLEEIEEEPYRVDRMLTQLRQSATFDKASAIIMGIFAGCNKSRNSNSFSLKEVLQNTLGDLEIPVAYGFPIGHIDENTTLPMGIPVEADTENMTVKILNSSVI